MSDSQRGLGVKSERVRVRVRVRSEEWDSRVRE